MPTTVDATRFLHGISDLFAPLIHEGQSFTAYLDEDNSLLIKSDNIITTASIDFSQVIEIASAIVSLDKKIKNLMKICEDIPPLQLQISSLSSGEAASPAAINEFNFSFVLEQVREMQEAFLNISTFEQRLSDTSRTATLNEETLADISSDISQLQEDFSCLQSDISTIFEEIAKLKSS